MPSFLEEDLTFLLKCLKNKDWDSFNLSVSILHTKITDWIKEDNPSSQQIHILYHKISQLISIVKDMKEKCDRGMKANIGTYLHLDDLTFYY